jgi:hypothetical protein
MNSHALPERWANSMRFFFSLVCLTALLIGYSSESLGQCGPSPLAPACNFPKCTPDGWVFFPLASGTSCQSPQGPGTCDGGELGPPGSNEPVRFGKCIPIVTGSLFPQYFVLHVIYAPPGTTGSGPKSSVTYSTGSTLGTETKTTSSFKSEVSVSAETKLFGFNAFTPSAGYAATSVSENGLSISKGESISISAPGGNADGINHDADAFYLWLNPRVNVSAVGNNVKWTFGVDEPMLIQRVHVGWLKDPSTMPQGVVDELAKHLITAAEFQTILSQDPFANGSTMIDTTRFVQTTTSVPYEPPFAAGEAPHSYTVKLDNVTTTSHTSSHANEYKVGLKVEPGFALISKLVVSTQFTWANSSSSTSKTTSTESASFTVTGPSFGYTGPTNLAVYYDTIYNTFMFAPIVDDPLVISGVVLNPRGEAVKHLAVTLTINRVRYNTITGLKGEYRFFGVPKGTAQLKVKNLTRRVTIGNVAIRQNFTNVKK